MIHRSLPPDGPMPGARYSRPSRRAEPAEGTRRLDPASKALKERAAAGAFPKIGKARLFTSGK